MPKNRKRTKLGTRGRRAFEKKKAQSASVTLRCVVFVAEIGYGGDPGAVGGEGGGGGSMKSGRPADLRAAARAFWCRDFGCSLPGAGSYRRAGSGCRRGSDRQGADGTGLILV